MKTSNNNLADWTDIRCQESISDALAFSGTNGLCRHLPEPFASAPEFLGLLQDIALVCEKQHIVIGDPLLMARMKRVLAKADVIQGDGHGK